VTRILLIWLENLPISTLKSGLFKILGGINAFPLCIDTKDKEEIIRFVKAIQPVFGAVNIEDIESPKVLEIIERLLSGLYPSCSPILLLLY